MIGVSCPALHILRGAMGGAVPACSFRDPWGRIHSRCRHCHTTKPKR